MKPLKLHAMALIFLSSISNAKTILNAPSTKEDLILAQELVEKHFAIWNDYSLADFEKKYAEVYAKDFFLGDPKGRAQGASELFKLVTRVHKEHPGFLFRPEKATLNHGIGRVRWTLGPKENSTLIQGEDIFTIENGRISSMRVFLNNTEQN
jgi:hypothetical protein